MKEFYPYTIIPQKVEKIRQEGIPMPKLPKLLPMPEKPKRKFLGTILFLVFVTVFITLNMISKKSYATYMYASFFISLISLVAMIFEFVQYGKLKKQFEKDLKHYQERKEAYKKVKAKQEKIEKDNKNAEEVKKFRQDSINEFFKNSYDTINAVHNEYSPAKKRFKLFLEEYFPDEVLDNIKVVHRTKKINYVPDFVIQFEKPKLNVTIEIEEPYTLSNVPENIQKDYEAKDRLRQRFANELGWIVIVLSEEQAVKSPTECCKFIEDSIESIFANIKNGTQFVNIKPIKKQKMLTGKERADLKKGKYREKYLRDAGLLDGPIGYAKKKDEEPKKETVKVEKQKTTEINGAEKDKKEEVALENKINKPELNKTMDTKKTPLEKKKEIENEQMQLIKKIAQKVKTVSDGDESLEKKKEPIKHYIEDNSEKKEKENVKNDLVSSKKDVPEKIKQPRKEEDILKDLQNALDKHDQKKKDQEAAIKEEKKADITKKEVTEIKKAEKKVKSAAEIILERKQKLQEEKKKEKVEDAKITKKEEVKPEEKVNKDELEKEKTETKTEKKVEKKPKKELNEEAVKNQKIIDAYREKIEGAVFDKQWDELINLCNEATKEVPYWDWAYYRRSTAWGHKREFAKVVLDCNKAIGFNPTLADAYYNRGTARFFLGKYMEACDDYQKSIDLNYIKKADAYFNRGLCFQKLEHKKKAYREFLKAKEMGSQRAIEVIKNHYTE